MDILHTLKLAIVAVGMTIASWFGVAPQAPLGASLPSIASNFETSLASAITSTDTSLTLTANAIRGGGALSGYTCFTLDSGTSSDENVCGTLSGTAMTSVSRGISYANGTTTVAANKFAHRRGASVKQTDAPLLLIMKAQLNGEETLPNIIKYTSAPTFSSSTDIVSKGYVDGIAIAGSPDATTAAKGIGRVSVAPVSAAIPIFVGDNDGRVPTQAENDALAGTSGTPSSTNKFVTALGSQLNAEKYAADAGANDTYVITLSPVPAAYVTGMVIHFKANTANTGAATLNVNSLGAITIVKGVSTTLADGDIAAGQYCTVIYDGTNFVLQNPVANNNITGQLGTWSGSLAANADGNGHQVTTDGFLVGNVAIPANNTNVSTFYTDSNATPTTVRYSILSPGVLATTNYIPFMMPVKKNDYYKIVLGASHTIAMAFIPLGI